MLDKIHRNIFFLLSREPNSADIYFFYWRHLFSKGGKYTRKYYFMLFKYDRKNLLANEKKRNWNFAPAYIITYKSVIACIFSSFGKLFRMNMVSIQLAHIMEILIFSSNVSMFIIMKQLVYLPY